ncbi:3799_t:CDS:2 [Funneliformis caledonium]|uniref:3799_t:CDS:1 n=1 Tax=Funneliformis caledonium TaxID=1117310 RepID=A0A9N8Z4H8_9GLOM|nr:3799_t:CDS:2 [Funneliformis caledonium]
MSVSELLSNDNLDYENFSNDFIKNILDDSESRHLKGRSPDTAKFKGPLETSNNVNNSQMSIPKASGGNHHKGSSDKELVVLDVCCLVGGLER